MEAGGSMAERWTCNSETPSSSPTLALSRPNLTLAGFVHASPEFKSSAMLVNSQLVCIWPAGILNQFHFKEIQSVYVSFAEEKYANVQF